jgi:hypothetical protein
VSLAGRSPAGGTSLGRQRTAASADSLGFTGDANLAAWPEAVRRVVARYHPVLFVPGHGPVALGDAPLRHLLDLLTPEPLK